MGRKEKIENIQRLLDQYLEIVNSNRNKENLKLWNDPYNWNRDLWRGRPVKGLDIIPYLIAPDNSYWSKILNVDLTEYYSDPYTFLETQLRMKIYHFNNFKDNTPFTDEAFIWFGVTTELSLFGCELGFHKDKEAWIKNSPISCVEDFKRLEMPDFYKSGLMPRIHEYYEVLSELTDGKLKVMFPEFVRGPFCIVSHMRGVETILCDIMLESEFFGEMMQFVVDAHKNWTNERNKFLKVEKRECKLYNDEVDCPTISPAIYEEMIFPYEKQLADYYGGVSYWHSCGNTTKLLDIINRLPNLDIFHVGPWTSYEEADKVFGERTLLDINLSPRRDVLDIDESEMENKLIDIMKSCTNKNFTVRADTFMPSGDMDYEINKIKTWAAIAKRVFQEKA